MPPSPKPRSLGWREAPLLAEAFVTLALASAAIRLLPFRRVAAAGSRAVAEHAVPEGEIDRVRRAVQAWARRVPWRAVCFQQGLAVHLMLRRRGVDSRLHYGVAGAPELAAHVWVSARGRTLIGGEEAPRFTCLATFPAAR